jgi:hypothetical protein
VHKKIVLTVLFVHLSLLVYLSWGESKPTIAVKNHVVVHTLKPPPTKVQSKPVAAPKKSTPKKVTPASPPKVAAKPTQKKSIATEKNDKKPAKEKSAPVTKIEPKEEKQYPEIKLDVPAPVGNLVIDHGPGPVSQLSSSDALIDFLHQSLHLPEFGEVKIEVTLTREGVVKKLVVLKAENAKNKGYLEREIPNLKFPRIHENEKTYILTFCNEL